MRVLLVSNSGRPFLAHCMAHVRDFLGTTPHLAFVSAATLYDEDAYYARVRDALGAPPPGGAGVEVLHLRWNADPLRTLARADALFVGGGNTYALLKRLREARLLEPIRERVRAGMPSMGASAGSNVAGPSILTTNDWNVVSLEAFEALGLEPFNVNPHTFSRLMRPWRREARRARNGSASSTPCGLSPCSASRKAHWCGWKTVRPRSWALAG